MNAINSIGAQGFAGSSLSMIKPIKQLTIQVASNGFVLQPNDTTGDLYVAKTLDELNEIIKDYFN